MLLFKPQGGSAVTFSSLELWRVLANGASPLSALHPVGFSREDNDAKGLMAGEGGREGGRAGRERGRVGGKEGGKHGGREGGGIAFLPLKRLRRLQGIIYPRSFLSQRETWRSRFHMMLTFGTLQLSLATKIGGVCFRVLSPLSPTEKKKKKMPLEEA